MAPPPGCARCTHGRNVDMDGHKFDTLSRTLAAGTSRRRVLGALAGSLVAMLGGRQVTQAQGNSECAALCKTLFGPGKDRGQCISAGARGEGPCADGGTVTCTGNCGIFIGCAPGCTCS